MLLVLIKCCVELALHEVLPLVDVLPSEGCIIQLRSGKVLVEACGEFGFYKRKNIQQEDWGRVYRFHPMT